MTMPRRESMSGISNEIIWWSALIPPINGHLLFADHDERTVIMGKNPIVAKTANNPTPGFDTTQPGATGDRKSTRLNSSHSSISYAVFCLKKKKYINRAN